MFKKGDTEKLYEFEKFTLRIAGDELRAFENKIDALGNKYVIGYKSFNLSLDKEQWREDSVIQNVILEVIRLQEEINNLKFHIRLEDKIK